MLFKESLISAITSIKSNATRSFLTSLAIIIGTAAVIAVIGLGSSAEKALEQSIDDLGGRTLYVSPGQNRRGTVTKGLIPLDIKDAEALARSGPQHLETPEKEKLDTVYFKIPQSLVSNVKDSRKVMQITVQVSTHYDQQVIDNIEKHSPALISEMLNVLGEITEKDIKDSEFKQILADDLKLVMNATLEEREDFGGIESVYFVEFIIQ